MACLVGGKMVYPNMDELPECSVDAVVSNIETLYYQQQSSVPGENPWSKVYSLVGPVLIALNPFDKDLVPCYSDTWEDVFRKAGSDGTIEMASKTFGPHCYCTSEQLYQKLASSDQKQAVVICGESGAGKTVTNKLMMNYLLSTSGPQRMRATSMKSVANVNSAQQWLEHSASRRSNRSHRGSSGGCTPEKLAMSNELLEAFGNAKTCRNDNSSRFGKYSKLFMQGSPLVPVGCEFEHYLLEKSRVVQVPTGERNYHILHYLAAETEHGEAYFKCVKEAAQVKLNDGSNWNLKEDFNLLIQNLEGAGFTKDQMSSVFDYFRAVLYLSNVEIGGDKDSSDIKGKQDLSKACELLGVDPDKFGLGLCQKVYKNPDGNVMAEVGQERAESSRDSVARLLYSRVFDWIIRVMNSRLMPQSSSKKLSQIGMLDIFGFEDMPINGFEQMFINLANESIQNLFNSVMLEKEMEVYMREGIDTNFMEPPNNVATLDMFMADKPKPGMIRVIADMALNPSSKDGVAVVERINKDLKHFSSYKVLDPQSLRAKVTEKKKRWPAVKIDVHYKECFQVAHYAGEVVYTVRDFLSKSKDVIEDHVHEMLQQSSKQEVRDFFAAQEAKKTTIGQKFREQLHSLNVELESSSIVFVRCVKPNPHSKPNVWDSDMVLEQLKCGGVVSALEMRHAGLPDRIDYKDFVEEFWILERGSKEELARAAKKPRDRCRDTMLAFVGEPTDEAGKVRYAFGQSKLFLKSGVITTLRRIMRFRGKMAAAKLQRSFAVVMGKKTFLDFKKAKERLAQASADIATHGFEGITAVSKIWTTMSTQVEKIQDELDEAMDCMLNDPRQAWCNVDQVCSRTECQNLGRAAGQLETAIESAAQRKAAVMQHITELLSGMMKEVNELRARAAEISTSFAEESEAGAEGAEDIKAKLDAGVNRLDAVLKQDLPKFQAEAAASMDLNDPNATPKKMVLPPGGDRLLEEARGTIASMEAACAEMLERRQKFQFEAMQARPELQALQGQRSELRTRLEELSPAVAKLRDDGSTAASEALATALNLDSAAEDLWKAAKSPDDYIAALAKFVEAAGAVEQCVIAAEGAKQQAAEENKKAFLQTVQSMKAAPLVQSSMSVLQQALVGMSEELEKGKLQSMENQATKEAHAKLTETLSQGLQWIQKSKVLEDGAQYDDLACATSISRGPWSPELYQILGQEVSKEMQEMTIMDTEQYSSLLSTIQALNSGAVTAEQGFCIGWSAALGSYFLLWQPNKQKEAFAALGRTPALGSKTSAAGSKFKEVVQKLSQQMDVKKLTEIARKEDQSIEEKLRAEIQEVMEDLNSRVEEADNVIAIARRNELAQIETEQRLQDELSSTKFSLQTAERDNQENSAREAELRQQLTESQDIVEDQRVKLRQIGKSEKAASSQKDFADSIKRLSTITAATKQHIGHRKSEVTRKVSEAATDAGTTEHVGSDNEDQMGPAISGRASLAPRDRGSSHTQCRGQCQHTQKAQAELRELRPRTKQLEAAFLVTQREFLKQAKFFLNQQTPQDGDSIVSDKLELDQLEARVKKVAMHHDKSLATAKEALVSQLSVIEGDVHRRQTMAGGGLGVGKFGSPEPSGNEIPRKLQEVACLQEALDELRGNGLHLLLPEAQATTALMKVETTLQLRSELQTKTEETRTLQAESETTRKELQELRASALIKATATERELQEERQKVTQLRQKLEKDSQDLSKAMAEAQAAKTKAMEQGKVAYRRWEDDLTMMLQRAGSPPEAASVSLDFTRKQLDSQTELLKSQELSQRLGLELGRLKEDFASFQKTNLRPPAAVVNSIGVGGVPVHLSSVGVGEDAPIPIFVKSARASSSLEKEDRSWGANFSAILNQPSLFFCK